MQYAVFTRLPKKKKNRHILAYLKVCSLAVNHNQEDREHISLVLAVLHLLPVTLSIDFNVLLLIYKVINGLGHSYMVNFQFQVSPIYYT